MSDDTADLIVAASTVHTMAADPRPVAALAIRGGRIAATAGPDDRGSLLDAWRGPGTVVIDDPGLVVLPAFVDTHNHLMLAAQNILGVPVSQADGHSGPGPADQGARRADSRRASGSAPPPTGTSCGSPSADCRPPPSSTRPRPATRCCCSAAGTTGCSTPPGCAWRASAAIPPTRKAVSSTGTRLAIPVAGFRTRRLSSRSGSCRRCQSRP